MGVAVHPCNPQQSSWIPSVEAGVPEAQSHLWLPMTAPLPTSAELGLRMHLKSGWIRMPLLQSPLCQESLPHALLTGLALSTGLGCMVLTAWAANIL